LLEREYCLQQAEECLLLADTVQDEKCRAYLHRLAEAWQKAADGDVIALRELLGRMED
jgi:hypothetical protein